MKVIVIGAGVGGLACAARLAAAGAEVAVLEQAQSVGGKLGVHRAAGFTWDTGPSLVTLPWTLSETLDATGAAEDPGLPLRRLDPIARTRFADGTWLSTRADPDHTATEMEAAIHPGAGRQWQALMARAAQVWEASAGPVLQQPLRSPLDLAPLARSPKNLAAVAPHRTLRSLGREYLSDPRLRMYLDRYATYTGSDPRRAPAALVTVPYAEHRWGGWYVEGGLGRIAVVLAARIRAHGGQVRLGAPVSRIIIDESAGRATGVVLGDGSHLEADVVVANADAAQVAGKLLGPVGDRFETGTRSSRWRALTTAPGAGLRRRLQVAPRSLSGYVLLLGVRDDVLPPAHHTVLFPADYDAEHDALFGPTPSYVTDPTIYLAVPEDPSAAPAGHRAWFVLVNAPRTDQVDDAPEGYADRLLDLMAARGIDVRGSIVHREVRTPADIQQRTLTQGGAIYGTSSNGPLAAFLRPPNVTDIEGLYLVGGSSHPGGGLPLVLLSAKIVANQLLG